MAPNSGIIIYTDIIIKIFRGNREKKEVLEPIQNYLGISVITAMELMNGANSRKREFEISKTIKAYTSYELSANIGSRAFSLLKKYHLHHSTSIADALIAATAIENKLPLYR